MNINIFRIIIVFFKKIRFCFLKFIERVVCGYLHNYKILLLLRVRGPVRVVYLASCDQILNTLNRIYERE